MSTFVKNYTTSAPRKLVRKNETLARVRLEKHKEGKKGPEGRAELFARVLGLQIADGRESRRGLVGYTLLLNGPGTYAIEEIAAAVRSYAKDNGCKTVCRECTAHDVVVDVQQHISPRAIETQPFFPYFVDLYREEGMVTVRNCEGAKQAALAALAPPASRKVKTIGEAQVALALPAPEPDKANVA